MSKREEINSALKEALKNKDMVRLATIRLIVSAMKDKDIASRTEGRNEGIDEAGILSLLQSMVKQRTESARIFRENARPELAEKEESEIAVIESFLPKALSEAEMAAAIESVIRENGAAGMAAMGAVMAALKTRYAGQMDMAKAGAMVKQKLSG